MITGFFDRASLGYDAELECERKGLGGILIDVQAGHILSESMMGGIEESEKTTGETVVVSSTAVYLPHRLPRHIMPLGLWLS